MGENQLKKREKCMLSVKNVWFEVHILMKAWKTSEFCKEKEIVTKSKNFMKNAQWNEILTVDMKQ